MSLVESQTPSAPPAAPKERYEWMDTCRGLSVLLIVLVHAGSLFSDILGQDVPQSIRSLDLLFSPYRIPMLVFLSGIFLNQSLKKGTLIFTSGKLRNVLWPYLVWTAIISFTEGGLIAWLDWRTWAVGGTTLWFLWFLMVYYIVGFLTARVPFLLVAVYALALSFVVTAETRYGSRLFLLMAYFFVGAFVGLHMPRMLQVVKSRWSLLLLPLIVAISVYFVTDGADSKYNPYVAPVILACIIGVCSLINTFSGPIVQALQFVGRNSVKYYVIHPAIYFIIYKWIIVDQPVSIYAAMPLAFVVAVLLATAVSHWSLRDRRVQLLFEGPSLPDRQWLKQLGEWADRVFLPVDSRPPALPNAAGSSVLPVARRS